MGVVTATPTETQAIPGGANTDIQYNDNGAFGGSAKFTYNASLDRFEIDDGAGNYIRLTPGASRNAIQFDAADAYFEAESGAFIFETQIGTSRVEADGQTAGIFRLIDRGAAVDDKIADITYDGGLFTIRTFDDDGSTLNQTPFAIASDGSITFNQTYSFPLLDGNTDQVLVTDGAGALTFQDQNASATTAWRYRTSTAAADPGGGNFRLNNLTIASATALYISTVSDNGVDFSTLLSALSAGDEVYFQNLRDADEAVLVTINSITDNTTWFDFGITVQDTAASATWTANETFGFVWAINASTGGTGDVIGPASSTDEAVVRFDGTTGKLLQDSNVTIDDTGNLTVGSGNIIVSGLVDGRDVAADGAVLDAHVADANIHVNHTAVNLTAGAGLIGGGDISASRSFDIVAGDASITVNPNDISVGVINATQHGNQTVGTLHALATTTTPGFVELATQAEVDAGTDTQRALTPDTLNNTTVFDSRYVDFVSNQTITGVKTFAPFASGVLGQEDIIIGDPVDYGLLKVGDSIWGRTAFNALSLDLDGSVLIYNESLPVTSRIEFAFADSTNDIRFALATPGVGNATYNARSFLCAGPAVLDDEIVTVQYWRTNNGIFDNIDCDTSLNGADMGVQHDLEVEGIIWVDDLNESTPDAGITQTANVGVSGDGTVVFDGESLTITSPRNGFGDSLEIGWRDIPDGATPQGFHLGRTGIAGFMYLMARAPNPQFIVGDDNNTGAFFFDGNGNKDIRMNTLDTGPDRDNVVIVGYGGLGLQDDAGDAITIRSAQVVAGTYTMTLPDSAGSSGQVLVNQDGAATLDWEDAPVNYVMPIWAEENAGLGTGLYEWAFGNGANTPSGFGIPLYVPAGLNAEVVAMGLSINGGGTATVQLEINGVLQGAAANVTVTGPATNNINTLGVPVPVVNGDVINFNTQNVAVATAAPAQAVVYIRIFS